MQGTFELDGFGFSPFAWSQFAWSQFECLCCDDVAHAIPAVWLQFLNTRNSDLVTRW